jgi:amidase
MIWHGNSSYAHPSDLFFQITANRATQANLYFSDGGAQELAAIAESKEPLLPMSKHILTDNPHVQSHTIHSMWEACTKRDAYRAEYAALWNSTASAPSLDDMVDVILSPAGPGAAPKLDTAKWWGYTSQWNLLDYPALVFPVDRVDVEVDGKDEGEGRYEPRNEKDRYNWELWEEHGAKGWEGAPVSLQVIGRR